MAEEQTPDPIETVYAPSSSWAPPFLALGLTLMAVGAWTEWFYAAGGAVIALAALRNWYSQSADEIDHLPRRQRPTTDVVPPPTR